MIIRELVSSFGIDFDESGAKRAEDSMKRLDNTFSAIGLGLSFAGVYQGLKTVLGLSSSVEEEANVLRQTFGEYAQGVRDWAETNSAAVGRSAVDLTKYAGQLGAVIEPMLKNKQAAAQMSEELAGLSVDLGSFFNKGDEETMERLRSGLLGSSEAVDQLGINLRAEHIQAVMAEKGLKGKFKTMSEGEKVQMRFLTIMNDTIDKQGDAARTIAGYANQLKVVEANTKDLGIAIGDKLMPVAKSAVGIFADFAGGLLDITKNSALVETSMAMLGGVGVLVGGSFIAANAGALLFGAGLFAVGLVLEDVYTSLEGGEGYFADFFKWIAGEDAWSFVLNSWKLATTELGSMIYELMHPEEAALRNNGGPGILGRFMEENTDVGRQVKEARLAAERAQRPGINTDNMSMAPTKSSWADEFRAKPAAVYKADRVQSHTYDQEQGGLGFVGSMIQDHSAVGQQVKAARLADYSKDFADSSGAGGEFSTNLSDLPRFSLMSTDLGKQLGKASIFDSGVPMSIPTGAASSTTHVTVNGGDVNLTIGPGATPDAVREGRRAAQGLLDDQNRSLVDSASSRK